VGRSTWVRIVLFLIGLAVIFGAAAGIGWLFLRNIGSATARPGVSLDQGSIERTLLGLYLNFRKAEIDGVSSIDSSEVDFAIQAGESASTISARLQRMGIIRDADLFRLLLRYWGVDARIEAGEYTLRKNMTMSEVAGQLQNGRLRTKTVTIREGLRSEEIAYQLAVEGLVDQEEFIRLVRDDTFGYDYLRDRPASAPKSLDGFLFPDTYQFRAKVTAAEIIDTMLHNFERRVTLEMRGLALDQGLDFYEALCLAAIVEREAVLPEERPIIASVYLNRLRKGMYLEADPTVQYAKGYDAVSNRWWPGIAVADLRTVDSPYNTYLNPGLPPSPICNPGLASIEAVLKPASTNYLFFLSKNDGSHAFAATFEEHLENQGKYR
jgi:UPF0755 protein